MERQPRHLEHGLSAEGDRRRHCCPLDAQEETPDPVSKDQLASQEACDRGQVLHHPGRPAVRLPQGRHAAHPVDPRQERGPHHAPAHPMDLPSHGPPPPRHSQRPRGPEQRARHPTRAKGDCALAGPGPLLQEEHVHELWRPGRQYQGVRRAVPVQDQEQRRHRIDRRHEALHRGVPRVPKALGQREQARHPRLGAQQAGGFREPSRGQ